jgi:hypothetical protein
LQLVHTKNTPEVMLLFKSIVASKQDAHMTCCLFSLSQCIRLPEPVPPPPAPWPPKR